MDVNLFSPAETTQNNRQEKRSKENEGVSEKPIYFLQISMNFNLVLRYIFFYLIWLC